MSLERTLARTRLSKNARGSLIRLSDLGRQRSSASNLVGRLPCSLSDVTTTLQHKSQMNTLSNQDRLPFGMKHILNEEKSDEYQVQMTDVSTEPSTKTQPINNTSLRRFLAAVKLLKDIVLRHGALIYIGNKLCIKYGSLRSLPEASTIQFIA